MTLLDLNQVRRNWDQVTPTSDALPESIAEVKPPHDALKIARELFDRTKEVTERNFPSRMSAIGPFLDQATRALEELEKTQAGTSSADPNELRAEILAVLIDLEDLFEALLGIGASTLTPPAT